MHIPALVSACLHPHMHVKAITYSRDTYRVTTADDKTQHFWERNLRLKTAALRTIPAGIAACFDQASGCSLWSIGCRPTKAFDGGRTG